MNLAAVIDISRQEFADKGYGQAQKADLIIHFLRDELGFTPDKFQEFFHWLYDGQRITDRRTL